MNTNNLKRFAREARIKLLDQVGRKLEFVLTIEPGKGFRLNQGVLTFRCPESN